jgi:hypothetical protein
MNTTKRTLCLALAIALGAASVPALADRGGHRGHYDGPRHEYRDHGYRHGHRHDYGHRQRWIGPAAALAITGLAAATWYATPRPVYVAPQPVYVQPQPVYVPARPTGGYWHYCPSAGGYYPNVNYCPEGWQAIYR